MNKAPTPKDGILDVTIPTIRFLGIYEPIHLQFETAYLKLFVRIVVVWCTFLLFRPRMAKAWKVMFGDNDEERQREIQERIAKLEHERDQATAGKGRKNVAIATGGVGTSKPTTPASATTSTEKGSAKRRKA